MSRMLGILSNGTVLPLWFERFRDAAAPGAAGSGMPGTWGVAGYLGKWATSFGTSGGQDAAAYGAACKKAMLSGSRILMSHIRKTAAEGDGANNPMIHDSWIFCNRGTIMNSEKLIIPRFAYEGVSASERLFKFLIDKLDHRSSSNYAAAAKQALDEIRGSCRADFLSFLMSDGKHLIACRDSHDTEGLSKIYSTVSGDTLLVCSEKLPGFEWKELEQGGMIVADRYGASYGL